MGGGTSFWLHFMSSLPLYSVFLKWYYCQYVLDASAQQNDVHKEEKTNWRIKILNLLINANPKNAYFQKCNTCDKSDPTTSKLSC